MFCPFTGEVAASLSALLPYFDLSIDVSKHTLTYVAWARWDLAPLWNLIATGGPGAFC